MRTHWSREDFRRATELQLISLLRNVQRLGARRG